MIKIIYDHKTVDNCGVVFRIFENAREKTSYKILPPGVVEITIDDFSEDLEFDVSMATNDTLYFVSIDIDQSGKVVVKKISEQAYLSQKHIQ